MNRSKAGQSLVESCIAIALTCLVFFGILQIAILSVNREVLRHAAARGARAKTVGLNWWMVEKCMRVAAIPNAGPMTVPDFENINPELRRRVQSGPAGQTWDWTLGQTPYSEQRAIERARIPLFLGAENHPRAYAILDYARWNSIRGGHRDSPVGPDGSVMAPPFVEIVVNQDILLWTPFRALYYADDTVTLTARSRLENHYPLYLDDRNW